MGEAREILTISKNDEKIGSLIFFVMDWHFNRVKRKKNKIMVISFEITSSSCSRNIYGPLVGGQGPPARMVEARIAVPGLPGCPATKQRGGYHGVG